MSNLIKKQFELTRGYFIKNAETLSNQVMDVQPEGFNNTIHWQIGHVLVSAESLLLGFPQSGSLPANYGELFGTRTKPSDWQGEVPTVETLIEQLKEQLTRLTAIPDAHFEETLPEPFLGMSSVGEIANFVAFHESLHLGQVQTMKRLIEASL